VLFLKKLVKLPDFYAFFTTNCAPQKPLSKIQVSATEIFFGEIIAK